jgi:hypothetical protein
VEAPFARAKRAYMEYVNELDTLSASSVSTQHVYLIIMKFVLLYLTKIASFLFQVTWKPYNAPELDEMIFSEVCSSEDELYMMQCPMICFWCVEWHLPHRVQRQFGRNQIWPVEDIPTSKELHK